MEVFQVQTSKDRADSMESIPMGPEAHHAESKL